MRLIRWLAGYHGAGDNIADSNFADLNDPSTSDVGPPFTIFDPVSFQTHLPESDPSTRPQSGSAASAAAGAMEVHDIQNLSQDFTTGLHLGAQALVSDGGSDGAGQHVDGHVTDQSGGFQFVANGTSGGVEAGSVTVTYNFLASQMTSTVQVTTAAAHPLGDTAHDASAAASMSDQPLVPVDPAPNSEVTVIHNTSTASNTFGAVFGVAYLTGGNTVLVGATPPGSNDSSSGGNPVDTDLQVAIVNSSNVSFVDMPLPGGSVSTDYIGGASVTGLTNGNFAVLYWGSNASNGGEGAQNNDNLPDYYVQIFTPDGTQVGGPITLDAAASNNFNGYGWITEDPANNGFVVSTATGDEVNVVVQRFSNSGTAGASFTVAGGYGVAYVDSTGDIVETYEDSSLNSKYVFIPAGATSVSSSGVLLDQSMPGSSYLNFTAASGGGFVAFYFSGTNLMAQTLSTTGVLGSPITVANVGSVATGNIPWSVVTLSNGHYAITLVPQSNGTYTEYPGTNKVIEVGPSLTSADTTIYDLTTSGGSSAVQLGPYAVAGPSGSLISYNETAGNGVSTHGVPLEATVTAVSYLGSSGPVVTAPNIQVSGGTGTGNAFKIGDTVTAIWNNGGTGDNNTDPVNGVTFDFSQFGGGSAVTATNNGGIWTATYHIAAGSIDTTNAHVAVTATDTSSNATTTSGSAVTVDDEQPVVTAAHISVSGGTGAGGAFKIGDTVTVHWDNSASGDHNTDTFNAGGVTFNFSQFGGGSAVTATNVGGIWTASYTITSGGIDTTSAHAAVTATDHVGNATTTSSGAATVDDEYPIVSAAHIGVTGGTGTGGAFKIGDTVTVHWDDSATTGDNNTDDINAGGVSVDFSQFGGGAVLAANVSGIWTATYTIVAGSIDTTNAHVAVTATDHVGNATTTAGSDVTADNEQPVVTAAHISVSGGTGTGGAFKIGDTVTATWDDSASGDHNTDTINGVTFDFSQFGDGSAVVAANSGGIWTATYTIAAGSIDTANAHVAVTATDHVGNATTAASNAATVDNEQPTAPTLVLHDDTGVSSSDRITNNPVIDYTKSNPADTLLYKVDGAASFSTTLPVFATDGPSDGSHTVTVEEEDAAGNVSATASLTFTLDTYPPTVSVTADHTALLPGQTALVSFDFSEAVAGFSLSDVQLSGGALSNLVHAGIHGGEDIYTATFTPQVAVHLSDTLSVTALSYADVAGNDGIGSNTITFTGDTSVPAAPRLALDWDSGVSATDHITKDPVIDVFKSNPTDTLLFKADNATSFTSSVPSFATNGSADGVHTVSVEEVDAGGNASPASSLTFTLDTTAPHLTGIAASPGSGSAMTGSTVQLTVGFNEAVNVVGGTPTLTLNDGGSAVYDAAATALLGDRSKLVFDHVVSATDQTSALAVTGFSTNGAAVSDVAGNQPNLSAVTAAFNALEINETSAPAYTSGGITRPELHFDSTGHILLDAAATAFEGQYGVAYLYLGLPPGTPYPPVPELHA